MKRSVIALLAAMVITSVVVAAIVTSGTIYSWEETFDVAKPEIQLFQKIVESIRNNYSLTEFGENTEFITDFYLPSVNSVKTSSNLHWLHRPSCPVVDLFLHFVHLICGSSSVSDGFFLSFSKEASLGM